MKSMRDIGKSLLRRGVLAATLALPTGGLAAGEVTVYKDPNCGCCNGWVDHMRAHGFQLKVENSGELNSIKQAKSVTRELASCHTAVVDGYVIEGHVPAADVKRLLAEKPPVAGLAVPGMPVGSPGMEGPNPQPYSVVSFTRDGKIELFSRH